MKLLTILTILLLLPITIAQEETQPISTVNIDDSVNWIMQQSPSTALEASLATLAATKSDIINNQDAAQKLLKLKNKRQDCWPSNNCNVKDTALAILALKRTGNTVSTRWLRAQEQPNPDGVWYLQIDTQASGDCNVRYEDKTEQIEIDNSRIKSDLCPFSTQFDLNNCLQSSLFKDKTFLDLVISCSELGTGKISLVYKADDKYFIVGEVSSNVYTTVSIQNSNFDDFESTLYTSYALKAIGDDVNSIIWLKRFYTKSFEASALMYLITEEEQYINDLLSLQDEISGSFGTVYETALATLALRKSAQYQSEVDLAKFWLESKVLEDGSWNKNIQDTAMAIYGAFGSLDLDLTPSITAPLVTTDEQPKECNENGACETFLGENAVNCMSDCFCGDEICDSTESEDTCIEDCEIEELGDEFYDDYEFEEEGRGFFFYFFIILILLSILGGLGYLYYTKFYLTGKKLFKPKTPPLLKQPTKIYKRPTYQQIYKAQPKRKTLAEKQLEKSLAEAKKLFKK